MCNLRHFTEPDSRMKEAIYLKWVLKPFFALTLTELYEALRLRQIVFVVEQNCPFIDNDKVDLQVFHLLGYNKAGEVVAYSRIIPPGVVYAEASIGRVVTVAELRGTGAGRLLMEQSIARLEHLFGKVPVRIEAQYYLLRFYRSFGFVEEGEVYILDGIEHIQMVRPAAG